MRNLLFLFCVCASLTACTRESSSKVNHYDSGNERKMQDARGDFVAEESNNPKLANVNLEGKIEEEVNARWRLDSVKAAFWSIFSVSQTEEGYRTYLASLKDVKTKPEKVGYQEVYPELRHRNVNMIGFVNKYGVQGSDFKETLYGKILRSLRFKNITDKVEKKYNLPENLILAMIMQETGGVDLLPNGRDDGGLGICHMQPCVARTFGLKTYEDNDKLVDFEYGKRLRELIDTHSADRKLLIKYDDRFNPVLNIEAVGRLLAAAYKGQYPIQSAIRAYSGTKNFPTYYKNVCYYQEKLKDEKVIENVKEMFNERNRHFLLGDKKANFDIYIRYHQQQNVNYGLNTL